MDLIADEDGATERVRELLRDQQLEPARQLLHDQLRLARRDGACWAQLANLERRCAKRRRKGVPSPALSFVPRCSFAYFFRPLWRAHRDLRVIWCVCWQHVTTHLCSISSVLVWVLGWSIGFSCRLQGRRTSRGASRTPVPSTARRWRRSR